MRTAIPDWLYGFGAMRITLVFLFFLLLQMQFGQDPTVADTMVSLCFTLLAAAGTWTNKTTDLKEDSVNHRAIAVPQQAAWRIAMFSHALLILPMVYLAASARWSLFALYGFIALMSYAYNYGVPYGGMRRFRLKSHYLSKNVVSAAICSLMVFAPPYLAESDAIRPEQSLSYACLCFLLWMVGEIFWDIRDVDGDRLVHHQTLPVKFGLRAAKAVAVGFLLAAYLVYMWLLDANILPGNRHSHMIFLLAFAAFSALIILAHPGRSALYFQLSVLIWLICFLAY